MTLLVPPEPPIVWPAPPDEARIRYVGQLVGSTDLHPRKELGQVFNELLYGPARPSMLITPYAVAVHADGERIAVADTNGGCVHVFDLKRQAYEAKDTCGPPTQRVECPSAVVWVGDELAATDARLHAVAIFGPGGNQRWFGAAELKRPAGITFNPQNELYYVSDAAAHAILAFDRQGKLVLRIGSRGAGPGQFNAPMQIACDPDGSLLVVDAMNFRVQRIAVDGSPLASFGAKGDAAGEFALPKGVAVGPDRNWWVVDAHYENIQGFTPDGKLLMALGREGRGPGEFWLPAGLCIDGRRRMWIADTYNRRVQVFELLESHAATTQPST